jgi:hypothetical protein
MLKIPPLPAALTPVKKADVPSLPEMLNPQENLLAVI